MQFNYGKLRSSASMVTLLRCLCGVMVSVFAISPKVRGFKPEALLYKGNKIPQHGFLQRRSKAVSPLSSDFTACKSMNKNTSKAIFISFSKILLSCY
jgi:hypothetical protein